VAEDRCAAEEIREAVGGPIVDHAVSAPHCWIRCTRIRSPLRTVPAAARAIRRAAAGRAAALVVSIVAAVGVCGYGVLAVILGPIAIFLGLSSQRRIRASGGALGGGGMAMAGWIVGMVATGLGAVYALIMLIFLGIFIASGMSHPSPSP